VDLTKRNAIEEATMRGLPSLLLVLGLLSIASPAPALDYPTRPVKAIVAVGAGGTGDIFMRVLGEELHRLWGQPVVVENRPGGASNIGARACAESPPDGYTICIMPGEPLAYNPFLFKKLSFDPAKDFEPIVNLFFNTQALVVNAALKARTVDELVALSKAKAGTLSYTAPSLPLALYLEKLKRERGADWVSIPFRGGGDTTNAVLSGSTPIAFLGMQNFISHLQAGTMTGLATDGAQRSPLFPDIPTLGELGYRGNLTRVYFGLLAPAGTPKPIIDKIRADVVRVAGDPAFRQKHLIDKALEPILNTPEEFARFLVEDRLTSERVVKEAGLQPQ
jgi:tripartite-type tricarboxylate transporter receptor subunit TctC